MVERWHQLDMECSTLIPGLSEAASDARIDVLADRMGDLADTIADTPALTAAGALLKLKVSMTIVAQEPYYAHGRMILAVIDDLEREQRSLLFEGLRCSQILLSESPACRVMLSPAR